MNNLIFNRCYYSEYQNNSKTNLDSLGNLITKLMIEDESYD